MSAQSSEALEDGEMFASHPSLDKERIFSTLPKGLDSNFS